jgi:hypothetical protein
MILIGIDPGNVTGMALWNTALYDAPHAWFEEPYETVGLQFRQWLAHKDTVSRQNIKVGVEKYTMTPGVKTAQPAALMTMGVIEDLCRWDGISWHYHLPATTKKQVSNALLRKLGWWTPTKDGHVNDALRLVLCELSRVDPQRYADLVGL